MPSPGPSATFPSPSARAVTSSTVPFAEAPQNPLGACPAAIGGGDLVADASPATREVVLESRITEHAYVDGGMHPSFRAQLKRYGAKSFSAKTSLRKYPISRPDAALADPFRPN
jgi:hypothetical protein